MCLGCGSPLAASERGIYVPPAMLPTAPADVSTTIDDRRAWSRRVAFLRWRINAAWCLEALLPIAFLASLALIAAVLAGRRAGWPAQWFGIAAGAAAAGALIAGFLRARRHFVSAEAARAQLDQAHALNNRLSSAAAGIGAWPRADEWRSGAWRWNWRRLAALPLTCAALIAAAFWIPISPAQRVVPPPAVKPPALAQVEQWLEALAQSEAIDPATLEQPREEAQQLAGQKPEEWYSHASLEAADHLKTKMEGGMRACEEGTAKVLSLLGAQGELSGADAAAWNEQLKGALAALEGNLPGLDRALMDQMRELDFSKLSALTPEQIEKWREKLRQAKKKVGDELGEEDGEGGNPDEEGRGGVARGPGHPPLSLDPDENNLGTKNTETIASDDFRQAALGDRIGMSTGQHEVDRASEHRAASGGGTAAEGAGAGAVWTQENLSPEERRRVRQFFSK